MVQKNCKKLLLIQLINWQEKKEEGEDKNGKWYRYWFDVDASFGGRIVKAMGRAGSRDKFFGKVRGELRELSDIDESNIRMAAFHNAMVTHAAFGGSTNLILHVPAIAHAAGRPRPAPLRRV